MLTMKRLLSVILCVCIIGYCAEAAARRKKYDPKPCIDCWGKLVRPNTKYWDGCNQVMCDRWKPAKSHFLTKCWCDFVDCVKGCGR